MEVKLSYDSVCPSFGWFFGWSVCHNFLYGREGSYQSICFFLCCILTLAAELLFRWWARFAVPAAVHDATYSNFIPDLAKTLYNLKPTLSVVTNAELWQKPIHKKIIWSHKKNLMLLSWIIGNVIKQTQPANLNSIRIRAHDNFFGMSKHYTLSLLFVNLQLEFGLFCGFDPETVPLQ